MRTVRMGELDFELLQEWINELIQTSGEDIFRMKGILAIKHAQRRFVYHAVHMMFNGDFGEPWVVEEPRLCKMVFIGKNLDPAALIDRFNACLVTPESERKKLEALRFAIGDKVECNTGNAWARGTVAALMYRDDNTPPGMVAPYQIKLDDGDHMIWAPRDHDGVIRAVGAASPAASPRHALSTPPGHRGGGHAIGHEGHAH